MTGGDRGTGGWVYIMASRRNGTLYTGVTSDLVARAMEHRRGLTPGFASKYGCTHLVWLERHEVIESAIQRETAIKRYRRAWKLSLIEAFNSDWKDLSGTCYERENWFRPTFTRRWSNDDMPDVRASRSAGRGTGPMPSPELDPRDGARG